MKVLINNKEHDTSTDSTLLDILAELNLKDTNGIAIAVNQTVVPKSNWVNSKPINEDNILLIKATQGGLKL